MPLQVLLRGEVKKSKTEGDVVKVTKESPKSYNKEGDVKEEIKPETKPGVTLDKNQGSGCPCSCEQWELY